MQLLVNHMREKWSSSVGFILASIGSAVGTATCDVKRLKQKRWACRMMQKANSYDKGYFDNGGRSKAGSEIPFPTGLCILAKI